MSRHRHVGYDRPIVDGEAVSSVGRLALGFAAAALVATTAIAAPRPEARHALVIGNAAYRDAPLANPIHDARDMARALERSGFEVVVLEDADLVRMARALRDFGDRIARSGSIGLFYFAGHGLQVKGRNFLVPVGASIDREDEVAFQALDVNAVLEKMDSARNRSNFVILDACRNNPFAKSFRLTTQGLAPMDAPPGTLIAFATAPGSTAADGTGRNGLYTQHLLAQIEVPGLKVEDVFKRARAAVRIASDGRQVPWENTSLEGDFYFRALPPSAKSAVRSAPQVRFEKPSATAPRRAEPPSLSPGDRWMYRRIDVSTGESGSWRSEVAAVEGQEVRTVKGDRYDREWALLFNVSDGHTYEPRAPRLVWPMAPGAEAKAQYRIQGSKDYPEWTVDATIRVVGLERVSVPAGSFDTFKVEVSGRYRQKRANGRQGSGTFKYVYWYSPEVKREVLRETESSKWDGAIESRGRYVLVDYSVR
jgi:Caspase domain